jgi:hypothetical protein
MIITGIDQAIATIGKLAVKKIVLNTLEDVGNELLRRADLRVPHKEGILKDSGIVIKESDAVLVGYDSEYASYQHQGVRQDGTRIIKNRPGGGETFWLKNTADENLDELMKVAQDEIVNELKKILT